MKSVLILFSLLSCAWSSFVELQSSSDYQRIVLDTSDVVIVYFWKDMDAFDQKPIHFALTVSNTIQPYGIKSVSIDCSDSKNSKVCQKASPPSIQLFVDKPTMNPYTRKNFRTPILYTGQASEKSIEKFISSKYPNVIKKVTSLEQLTVNSDIDSKTPRALLFSDKSTIPIFFKSIFYQFNESISSYHVHSKENSEIAEYYNISVARSSLALLLPPYSPESLVQYNGSLNLREEIVKWLQEHLPSLRSVKGAGGPDHNKADADHWRTVDESLTIESLSPAYTHVLAVMPNDPHSQNSTAGDGDFLDTWRTKLVPFCEGNIKAVLVKCSSASNSSSLSTLGRTLCSRLKDSDIPFVYTVPYVRQSSASATRSPAIDEKFVKLISDSDEIKTLALESIPKTHVQFLLSDEAFQRFVSENQNARKVSVIALSTREEPSNTLFNIALTVFNTKSSEDPSQSVAEVGFMASPRKDFLASIGNPKLPAIISVFFEKPSIEENLPDGQYSARIMVYDPALYGPIRHDTVVAFIENSYSRSNFGAIASRSEDSTFSSGSGHSSVSLVRSQSDWDTQCSDTFKGICAIGFVKHLDSEDESQKIFKTVAQQLGRSSSVYKYMLVDADCQKSFAEKFDVTSMGVPTVVAYSVAKKRYATYRGSFTQAEVRAFFESVLSGGKPTSIISPRPVLSDTCEQQSEEGTDTPYEDEDASDLMAEIRREEEERAKALKKEAEEETKRLKQEESNQDQKKSKSKSKSKKNKKMKSSTKNEL